MTALSDYRKKRDFSKTSEPSGEESGNGSSGDLIFVVQEHHASRLHYDFRLEWKGTLKSWAVPKGPSNDPDDKRLAVRVEDHPLDYANFEGVIPKGEYGAGEVLVWDRGIWKPEKDDSDPGKSLEKGHLKFRLHGEKLKGGWTLTKMKGRGEDNWLLIKHKDRWAAPQSKKPLVERKPGSVKSGRSAGDIAGGQPGDIEGAESSKTMPENVEPELAKLVDAVPEGGDWLHEVKYDGYRILAFKKGNKVRLLSRNGKDWTTRFRSVAKVLEDLDVDAILDGEVVVWDRHGRSSFQALQRALKDRQQSRFVYCPFDLLWSDGYDLRGAALTGRKEALRKLLERAGLGDGETVRYGDHLRGNGTAFYKEACKSGLEGIISKKALSTYQGKRTRDWLKVKCVKRQEFVIGGFTEPSGSREGFGALLLGVYDKDDHLRYAGRVGTGFDSSTLSRLREKLDNLTRKTPAFDPPPEGREAKDVTWVKPELVGEVSFTEWTSDARLRHPSFQGLREDKPASGVHREVPETSPSNPSKSKQTMKLANIRITNAGRQVFPGAGITKGEVAAYYQTAAEHMLPYVENRPLSVVRCPEGRQKQCFYQKHHSQGMPEAVGSVKVAEKSGKEDYLTVNSVEGVVALAQFGVLEIHPWLSRNDHLDRPDHLIFDLDPADDVKWEEVLGAAYLLKDILAGFDLESFPKITGGKGVHVVVPVTRRLDFDTVKPACKAIASRVRDQNPDKFLIKSNKSARKGKIFIDYLRNGRGATAVAPFSLRARADAPVAVPLSWDEISPSLKPDQYNLKSLPRRLSSLKRDPWEGYFKLRQSLKKSVLKDLGVSES